MKNVTLIAAVSANGVIGLNGGIPWKIPEDMRRFKELTTGHSVVMGRKTYESIGRPLPNRRNFVVSNTMFMQGEDPPGIHVCESMEAVLMEVDWSRQSPDHTIFVIGGSRLYEAAMPLANRMELTVVHQMHEGDTFFPYFTLDWTDPDRIPYPWKVDSWDTHGNTHPEKPSFSFVSLVRR